MARRVAWDGFDTWKTTVKVPSTFSPKCWLKMASACPESLPGTASEVDSRAGKRAAENVPTMITAIQSAITKMRQRMTTWVHRSSMGAT